LTGDGALPAGDEDQRHPAREQRVLDVLGGAAADEQRRGAEREEDQGEDHG
jgi:hypothetical protein